MAEREKRHMKEYFLRLTQQRGRGEQMEPYHEKFACRECGSVLTPNPMEGGSSSWMHFNGPKDCKLRGAHGAYQSKTAVALDLPVPSARPAEQGTARTEGMTDANLIAHGTYNTVEYWVRFVNTGELEIEVYEEGKMPEGSVCAYLNDDAVKAIVEWRTRGGTKGGRS